MGRPKEFDREEALASAMRTFWTQGYEATSMQDLCSAMGIHRGSLYDTFGDKRSLFLAAVEHYKKSMLKERMTRLRQAPSPTRGIREFFSDVVESCSQEGAPQGCLITNAATQLSQTDKAISYDISQTVLDLEEAFYEVLERAQEVGELDPDKNIRALARYFTCVAHGLNVMGKVSPRKSVLKDIGYVGLGVLN